MSKVIVFEGDDELMDRVSLFNDNCHDMETLEGISFLMNHFIRLGLAAAEAEHDRHTAELF